MAKRARKGDLNQIAASIVAQTTNQTKTPPEKNPAAVALGRLGGLKGGRARAAKMTAKERKDIATKAAKTRWGRIKDRDNSSAVRTPPDRAGS